MLRFAGKFRVKAYGVAVNHDHVHFVLKVPGRAEYIAFLRALTGAIARKFGKGLWSLLPFTRVVAWGRDFRGVLSYLKKNREEASGARPYEPRVRRYGKRRLAVP